MKHLKLAACDCETVKDFGQYYNHGMMAVPAEHIPMLKGIHGLAPVHILGAGEGRKMINMLVYTPYSMERGEEFAMEWEFLKKVGAFGKPLLGTVDCKDTFMYLWDHARRESAKGLRFEHVSTWTPDMHGLNKLVIKKQGPSDPRKTAAAYWTVYNPKYTPWKEAVIALENGDRVAAPITTKVGLYLAQNSPNILVSYKYKTVGHLDGARIVLASPYKYFGEILKNHVPDFIDIR